MVVQSDTAGGHHCDGVDRLLVQHAVEPHPPDRAGRQRANGNARVPKPAQRALPPLPGIREQRLLTAAHAARPPTTEGGREGAQLALAATGA